MLAARAALAIVDDSGRLALCLAEYNIHKVLRRGHDADGLEVVHGHAAGPQNAGNKVLSSGEEQQAGERRDSGVEAASERACWGAKLAQHQRE